MSLSEPVARHTAVFAVLDRWRILLALLVVLMHAEGLGILPRYSQGLMRQIAHDAVIGFFVISGYSVMQAAAVQRWQVRPFLVGRWSRLYSVALPALVVTLCLDALGRSLHPDLYPTWMYRKWWLHFGFHGLFLGEAWTNSYPAFSNVPWWSLGYEAWYYLLLAAALLPLRYRVAGIIAVLICMGPRVLLLLPCWLLGVWAWRLVQDDKGPVRWRWPHWLTPSALLLPAYLAWTTSPWALGLRAITIGWSSSIAEQFGSDWRLSYSRWFLADWLTALLFALAILALAARSRAKADAVERSAAPIRYLAFHSFGIYLLHYPLLLLASAMGLASRGWLTGALITLMVVGLCVLLSALFSKSRPAWQRLLQRRIWQASRPDPGS